MQSVTQPHYYGENMNNTIEQSNGEDFIPVILICFIITIVCAFPVVYTESSSNKSK